MTKEEIVTALLDDVEMPYLQDWQARDIVDFVIKNYKPSLPSDLDEAAQQDAIRAYAMPEDGNIDKVFKVQEARIFHEIGFKAGAKWMAGQGVTKEVVIGMATEEISVTVSKQTLDDLDLRPGDKVLVQIRKK